MICLHMLGDLERTCMQGDSTSRQAATRDMMPVKHTYIYYKWARGTETQFKIYMANMQNHILLYY